MGQSELMSLLKEVLEVARLAESRVTRALLVSPWGLQIDPSAELALHLVQDGRCWLHADGQEAPLLLEAGDVALIRAGTAHSVTDAPDSPTLPYREGLEVARDRALTLSPESSVPTTRILCAKYSLEDPTIRPLLSGLPPLAKVGAASVQESRQLRLLTEVLDEESSEAHEGGELLLPRLIDSFLILVLRAWIESQGDGLAPGLGALKNPEVSQALRLMHERPDQNWAVEDLARRVGQSRATFHRRFVALLGETPAAYLLRYRMGVTAHLLRHSELSLEAIAARVGYESAAALSKAFRRTRGVAPGQFRAEHGGAEVRETGNVARLSLM